MLYTCMCQFVSLFYFNSMVRRTKTWCNHWNTFHLLIQPHQMYNKQLPSLTRITSPKANCQPTGLPRGPPPAHRPPPPRLFPSPAGQARGGLVQRPRGGQCRALRVADRPVILCGHKWLPWLLWFQHGRQIQSFKDGGWFRHLFQWWRESGGQSTSVYGVRRPRLRIPLWDSIVRSLQGILQTNSAR